ncbi:MAG: nitroreductase family protein [Candidatus Peribacteraceae bacterium]|nr:nitroreductase family protein [Candidatus Peribacteraceae bacterium]
MFEIENLLNRRTVKKFSAEKISNDVLDQAIRVAYRAPTSLNSRPVILLDISKHKNEDWINFQPAAQTAPHLFLFAVSPEAGEKNAREFLAGRYGSEIGDERVSATIKKIVAQRDEWARQQAYLVTAYFTAILEASGAAGCIIAGFDKKVASEKLELPDSYTAELIFACGFADPGNDGSVETDFVRKFDDFYFPAD